MEATKHFYIYPIYFDSEESCASGRRVPRHAAHKSPRVEDLLVAVQCCSFVGELEKNKSHPKSSMGITGRIKVTFNEKLSKNQLLLNIASKIKINTTAVQSAKGTNEVVEVTAVTPNLIMKPRSKKKTRNNK